MGVVAALAIGALALSAVGTIQSGIAANQQAKFQSQVQQQQATRAKQVAESNERSFRRKISRAVASTRATQGEITGSKLGAVEDFVAEAEADALNIRQGGQIQSSRLLQQADLLRMSGKQAQTASFIRTGSQLLSGLSTVGRFGSGGGVSDAGLEPQLFDEG
jgi:hypothetical protein